MPPHAPSVTSSRPWELQNRTLGSESRFWLSERFLGPIWLTVFWRPDFCRILGGALSRAQRYLQSPLGASKSNLGWLSERFLGPIWLTVFGDQIFVEFWGVPPHAPSVTSSRPWELQNRTLGSESRFSLSERFLGPIWLTVFCD